MDEIWAPIPQTPVRDEVPAPPCGATKPRCDAYYQVRTQFEGRIVERQKTMGYIFLGILAFFWLTRGGPVGFPFIFVVGMLALMMARRGSYSRRPPGYGGR